MDNQITISDFVKLTRSTIKTVLYYHKIGLLQEPKRSSSGYRLYGAEELARMRLIKHLKQLGLDLKQIKEILGDTKSHRTLREILQSFQTELLNEKKMIEEQLSKIETLLSQQTVQLEETSVGSELFQMVTQILAPEQLENYSAYPELYEQQRNIFGILEDFNWGEDYQENFRLMAEYFKSHPEQFKTALKFGKRLSGLKQMSEDDPEIEILAREGADFIKSVPFLKKMLQDQSGFGKTNEKLFNEMAKNVLSPAQIKHKQLIQKYLNYCP
ncbi:MerR family transcriptional regulator [Neobacillus sp. LXY-4]|uniref:helix-turn-helix domain-containing protein n=1 Tax=Neobacillus sp. LXY-4 TaxID=3379826 RepID=UPI003EE05192